MSAEPNVAIQPRDLALVHESQRGAEVLHVFGDADYSSAEQLEATLRDVFRRDRRIVVNLSLARFIDSSVISVLIRAHKRFGTSLHLVIAQTGAIARILTVAGVAQVFQISSTVTEAATR